MHRTSEGVLDKLIDWAASLETSSNQPILPYVILVLNGSENNIDPTLWDVDKATTNLLDSLSATVDKNPYFKKHAETWRKRGKQIKTIEDLVLCYYCAFRVGPSI